MLCQLASCTFSNSRICCMAPIWLAAWMQPEPAEAGSCGTPGPGSRGARQSVTFGLRWRRWMASTAASVVSSRSSLKAAMFSRSCCSEVAPMMVEATYLPQGGEGERVSLCARKLASARSCTRGHTAKISKAQGKAPEKCLCPPASPVALWRPPPPARLAPGQRQLGGGEALGAGQGGVFCGCCAGRIAVVARLEAGELQYRPVVRRCVGQF